MLSGLVLPVPIALPRLWNHAARTVLQAALPVPAATRLGPRSQLHAGRVQSSVRRARGVVWIPAPNARLCLCRISRIRCREWRRG